MLMRLLTVLILGLGASLTFADESVPKLPALDAKANRLIDRDTKKMYSFYEVKGIHVVPAQGKSKEDVYAEIKKKVDALAKEKNPPALKGNPASFFCADRLKGKNRNFVDLAENEFAICEFEDGTLVDAWDVFRLRGPQAKKPVRR